MTGEEHFTEADRLITTRTIDRGYTSWAEQFARAQVHATLALVAATKNLRRSGMRGAP